MIDTHAHLNDEKLYNDLENVIVEAKEMGVSKIVCASYDLQSSFRAVEISSQFDSVFATVGIHPHDSKLYNEETEKQLKSILNKRVIALGEIGLDYHYDLSPRDIQKSIFQKQIDLADNLELPIVIHMRQATQDTLEILKINKNKINNGGIFHCFSGSYETFKIIYDMGFIISFGGALTFKNAENQKQLLRKIPKESFVLETDCPYLTPVPYRGKINYPKYVSIVYDVASEILGIKKENLIEQIRENTQRILKI